jgi:hypothetical protein
MTEATPRPPDHPIVPRPRRSIRTVIAALVAVVICGTYAQLAYSQRELEEPQREEIPASVRSSPGGYRSYHFWHSGYHGGK